MDSEAEWEECEESDQDVADMTRINWLIQQTQYNEMSHVAEFVTNEYTGTEKR